MRAMRTSEAPARDGGALDAPVHAACRCAGRRRFRRIVRASRPQSVVMRTLLATGRSGAAFTTGVTGWAHRAPRAQLRRADQVVERLRRRRQLRRLARHQHQRARHHRIDERHDAEVRIARPPGSRGSARSPPRRPPPPARPRSSCAAPRSAPAARGRCAPSAASSSGRLPLSAPTKISGCGSSCFQASAPLPRQRMIVAADQHEAVLEQRHAAQLRVVRPADVDAELGLAAQHRVRHAGRRVVEDLDRGCRG